ncbi:MAG: type II secretion system secretin GspD [Gammaproteobacteria bacterium]|nr:MAG: type II secretion system protein GspD [Gammaproteobacteria bacterium]|tara:strand:- start:183 stop:2096 length:1914 start_codon:yes stop_codon:yes gene_type:complete
MTFSFKNYVLLSLALFVLTVSYFVNSAQINMRDADIRAFASDMAKISNKTIVLDPRVKGNVTVVSNQDLDAGEAYAVFLAVLRVNGYSAVENNGVVKVIPESGARQDASINNLNKDSLSTEVIRLKQANAKVLSPLLKPLINKQGHITAYEPTNSIIIADYVGNTERIKSILLEIDKNPADTFELIPLQNTSSNEIARILGSMWKGDNQMTKSFTALSVERSNSILLRGQKTVIEQLKGVISKLDSNTSPSSNLKVIYLKYAQAEDLTSILENVALTLEEEQLTSSTGTKKTTNISFHSDTNALVISAQPDILKSLESVISQLDIKRAQVLVEALIVEVSDKLARELGVQFLFTGDGDNAPIAAQKFGSPNPELLSTIGSEISDDSSTASTMKTRATNSLLGLEGLAIGVAKYRANAESFAAILNLVSQDGDSNILSTPSIMTMDNEESSIIVGQEIPITTGETLSGSNSNPFRSVTRQEVGVKLQVRPQINEGNAVKMYIVQEVSSIFGPIGDTSSDLITNKRNIKTTVLVDDGETIVLGGLIDDDVQETINKVPVLGNIPLLGRVFTSTTTTRTKRNLMVFLRPTIVRDSEDVRSISNRKYNYFQAIEAELLESGKLVPDTSILDELLTAPKEED